MNRATSKTNLFLFLRIFILIQFVYSLALGLDDKPIELHYHNKPPYYFADKNGVHGIVIDKLKSSLDKAKIPFKLVQSTPDRQLYLLKDNTYPSCFIGWFKNESREQVAKFTKAIHKDQNFVALIHKDNQKLIEYKRLKDLFRDDSWLWIKQRSYSYGQYIDSLAQAHSKYREVSFELPSILKILIHRRADLFLLTRDEAVYLISQHKNEAADIVIHEFKDSEQGKERYLMCNKATPDALIAQINSSL